MKFKNTNLHSTLPANKSLNLTCVATTKAIGSTTTANGEKAIPIALCKVEKQQCLLREVEPYCGYSSKRREESSMNVFGHRLAYKNAAAPTE